MWHIRNREEDHRGREGKWNGKSSEREKNHDRLFTIATNGGWPEERGGDDWGRGIKEVTPCNERWVLHTTDTLLKTTSETNDEL